MADERGTIRNIAWSDVFPWLLIGRSLRLSVGFRALLLAALALIGTAAGWRVVGAVFSGSEDVSLRAWRDADGRWPWSAHKDLVIPDNPPQPWTGSYAANPIVVAWYSLTDPFRRIFDINRTFIQLAYLTLGCLWTLVMWAFFGGAITRMAAMALTREDRLSLRQSIRFAQSKWPSFFFGPIFPLVGVLLITLPAMLLGLIMRADIGVLVGGILWPLVLLAGLMLAVILIGFALGWPLMWATISVEGTDHFDALSRAYNYIRERPLYYAFYTAVAALLGLLGSWLVIFFGWAVVHLAVWAASWGTGVPQMMDILYPPIVATAPVGIELPPASNMHGTVFYWGAHVVSFFNGCVAMFVVAFFFSYFWSAATAVYLLLRRHVDGTELDEVHVEEEDELYGLPPLTTDAAGVPGVGDKARPADLSAEE